MEHGLRKALEKRPVTDASFRTLVSAVERDIQRRKTNELTSAEIGEVVMERLKTFDTVAYIRFASVYRQFEDVESFKREVEGLGKKPKKRRRKTRR
jgi:transcriptional repressor NrdR